MARASSHGSSQMPEEETVASSSKEIAKMVGASAMFIPHFTGVAIKGLMVDLPVAMSEGFRNTPKLYGEQVSNHAPVTDWKSGFVVAGTTFAHQMAEGITDLLVQPVKGAAKGGIIGFGKGVGAGALQSLTKPAAACIGLVGYTSQGIYKSLYTAVHSRTKKSVASARRVQDKYFIHANGREIETSLVLEEFDRLSESKSKSGSRSLSASATPTTMSRTSTAISRQTPRSSTTIGEAAPEYQERETPNSLDHNPSMPNT